MPTPCTAWKLLMRRLGFTPGASRMTKPIIPTAPPVAPPLAPVSLVGAGILRFLGVGAGDDFPNAPVGWTPVSNIAWAGTTVPYWPGQYQGDDGSHVVDYGTDWPNSSTQRLAAPISAGATSLTVTAPNDTTVNGVHAIGAQYLKVASAAGWSSSHRFTVGGFEYAVAFTDTGDGPRIRLSRPLRSALVGGEAVAFQSNFAPGAAIQIGQDPYELKTITTHPDRFTVNWTGGLSNGYPTGTRVTRNYRNLCTIEVDSSYPGANKNVLRQRLPAGFPGGYCSANLQRHPSYAGNVLRWPAGLSHGFLFMGVMMRVTPSFSLNGNVGNKVIYLRSSANPNINHIPLYLANDGGTGDQGYPTLAPQNPGGLGAYGCPQIAANDGHQGGWHRYEILLGPGTPGAGNGTAKLWMDGRLLIDRADCRWFEAGQTPDFDQIILTNVFGGGLNYAPQDQSNYIGRVFASVA